VHTVWAFEKNGRRRRKRRRREDFKVRWDFIIVEN
jgi:hypothetical protein